MNTITIDSIYKLIPDVSCQGLCQQACGPVLMSKAEERRIIDRTGKPVSFNPKTLTCDRLTAFGRCSIYPDRPAICRLFGAVDDLPCQWGCKAERPLSSGEGGDILRALESLG